MAALSITASSFVPSSQAKYIQGPCISGEALTAGQPVYKNAAGVYVKARANDVATYVAHGFAVQSVGSGVRVDILRSDPNLAIGATVAEGTAYAVGASASGTVEPLSDIGSGEFLHLIAVGLSSTNVAVDFDTVLKTTSAL